MSELKISVPGKAPRVIIKSPSDVKFHVMRFEEVTKMTT